MVEPSITRRVETLEERVSALSTLPDRMTALEAQVATFRAETNAGFTALREEMQAGDAALRGEIRAGDAALRDEIRAGDATLRDEIRRVEAALRKEIQSGDEETRRYMRVLHEGVIERIKTVGDAIERRPRKPRRS